MSQCSPGTIELPKCDVCNGEGRVAYIQSAGGFSEPADCYKCGGSGRATQPAHGSAGTGGVHPVEKLWRECDLPEWFLGNGGSNTKLYALYDRIRHDAQSGRNDALRLLADLFTEAEHETWRKEEIVNIIEDAIRLGSLQSQPSCHEPDDAFCMVCNPPMPRPNRGGAA